MLLRVGEQRPEPDDGAGQPVELGGDDPAREPGAAALECCLEAWAVERSAGLVEVLVPLGDLGAGALRPFLDRPSFTGAAPPERAEALYERFCAALRDLGVPVETGAFGARMSVSLVNDGPVTIILDVD